MEFCGRCGSELGRGVERGRFCPRCGHETSGDARYPLYADGSAAVTRRRPSSVSPEAPAEVTRPRLPALTASERVSAQPRGQSPETQRPRRSQPVQPVQPVRRGVTPSLDAAASWHVALLATSLALLLILVLGILLLL